MRWYIKLQLLIANSYFLNCNLFFPLSLLNDVIHRVIICLSVGLPAPGELSRGWKLLPLSGHSTVRQQLLCLQKVMNIQPPPQRNITPQFLFCCLVVFYFSTRQHLETAKKKYKKIFYTWMSPVKYGFFFEWGECFLAFMDALSSFLTLQCKSVKR